MSDLPFWKNLVFVFLFFTLTPLTIGISLFSLSSLAKDQKVKINPTILSATSEPVRPLSGLRVYASLPSLYPQIGSNIESADARVEIIRQYLDFYNSPLTPQAKFIVDASDKYGLDFRLTTAIAQKESNLCKIIPPESYNCWGWGIHEKGTLGFDGYEKAIETVSRGLREEYLDKGYQTIEEIMSKYTPLSKGSWAEGVGQFMSQMQ